MRNPYQTYKKTAVQSASREKLLLLMYEGAIRYVKQAIIAVQKDDIAGRGQNIGAAFDVIMELNNTLDHKLGGEVAQNLEQLYMFMTDQLVQANVKGDEKKLQDVLNLLNTLYSGWKEAVEKLKRDEELAK